MILWKCFFLFLLPLIWTADGDYEKYIQQIQQHVVPYINKSLDLNSGPTAIVQVFQCHQLQDRIVIEELKWNTKRMEVYMKNGGISQGLAFVVKGQGKNISLNTRDLVTGQLGFHQAFAPNYHVVVFPYFFDNYSYLNNYVVTLKNGKTGEEVKCDTVISYVPTGHVSLRNSLYASFAPLIDKSIDLYSGKTALVQVFQWQLFANQSVVTEELKWNPTRMDIYVRDGSPFQGLAFLVRGQGDNIDFYTRDIATGQVLDFYAYGPTYRVASFGYLYNGTRQHNDFKLGLKNGETGEAGEYGTVFHYVEPKDQTTTVATTTTTVATTTTTVATTTTTVAPTTTTTLSPEEVSFRKDLMDSIDTKVNKSIDLYSGKTSFVHVFHWQIYENQPKLVLEEHKLDFPSLPHIIYVNLKNGCTAQGLAVVFRGQGNNFSLKSWNYLTGKYIEIPTYLPIYHVASIVFFNNSAYFLSRTYDQINLKNKETNESELINIRYIRPGDQTTTVAPTTTTLSPDEVSFRKNLEDLIDTKYNKSIHLFSGNTSFVHVFHWQTYENQPKLVLEEYKINEKKQLDIYLKAGCTAQGLAFVFKGRGKNISLNTYNYVNNSIKDYVRIPTYPPSYRLASINYLNHSAYSHNFDFNFILLKNEETEERSDLLITYIRPENQTTTVAPTTTTTLSPEEISFRKDLMDLIDTKVNKSIDLYSGNTSFVHVFHWQTYENQPKLVLEEYKLDKNSGFVNGRLNIFVKDGCTAQGLALVFRGQGNNFSLKTWDYSEKFELIELPTYLPKYHMASINYLSHSAISSESSNNALCLKNKETGKIDVLYVHYIRPEDQTTTVTPTESPTEILGFPLSDIEGIIAPLISKSIDLHSGKTMVRQIMQWDKSEDGTLSFKQIMWQVTEINVFVKRNITDQGLAFVIQGTGDRFRVTLKSEKTGAETTREANLLENRVVMIPFGENGQKMVDEELRFIVENLGTGMKHTSQQVIRLTRKSFIDPH